MNDVSQSHYNCPEKHTLDSKGHCSAYLPGTPDSKGKCLAYCEVRLTMFYGQEVPFEDAACQAESSCSISPSQSITVTNTYSFNVGASISQRDLSDPLYARDDSSLLSSLKASFDAGASYSWSESVTYSTSQGFTENLNTTSCGYWTFVPYVMEQVITLYTPQVLTLTKSRSCGTVTSAAIGTIPSREDNVQYCNKNVLTDTGNYCNRTPYMDGNGHAQGVVLFVFVDCATGELLPMSAQKPPYNYPGVSTSGPSLKNAMPRA